LRRREGRKERKRRGTGDGVKSALFASNNVVKQEIEENNRAKDDREYS